MPSNETPGSGRGARSRRSTAPEARRQARAFGSRPKAAVFTSAEVATRSAIARASSDEEAPLTVISRTTVAPSPSATICRARSEQTPASASSVPESRRCRPFASSTTASFVEQSPSTEMRLNDCSTAGRGTRPPRPGRAGSPSSRPPRRREAGMDHPCALRHAPDGEPGAGADGRLRPRMASAPPGESAAAACQAQQAASHRQARSESHRSRARRSLPRGDRAGLRSRGSCLPSAPGGRVRDAAPPTTACGCASST